MCRANRRVATATTDSRPTQAQEPPDILAARKGHRRPSKRNLREIQRLLNGAPRAAGIAADRWSRARIGHLLRERYRLTWGDTYAVRALRKRGITVVMTRARAPHLTPAKLRTLRRLLVRGPERCGLHRAAWSRACVAELIKQRFGVHFSLQHVSRLLKSLRWPISPGRRASRLTTAQAHELQELLGAPAATVPNTPWSLERLAILIRERFGVDYRTRSIARVLARWQIAFPSRQPPSRGRITSEQRLSLSQTLRRPPNEWGLSGSVWTQERIAQLLKLRYGLHYRPYNIHRMLARHGFPVTHRARPGGLPKVNEEQLSSLRQAMTTAPAQLGAAQRWTRKRVAEFILEQFHVSYAPSSIPGLLRRHGLRLHARSQVQPATATTPTSSARSAPESAPTAHAEL